MVDEKRKLEVQKQVAAVLRVNRRRVGLSIEEVAVRSELISSSGLERAESGNDSVSMRIVFNLFSRIYRPTILEILFFCTNGRIKPEYLD